MPRLLQRLSIGLILVLGALSVLAYLLTPLLGNYRDDLAAALSQRLGVPVGIGRLQTRWHALGPALQLYDVTLGQGAARLDIPRARLDLYWPGFWDRAGPGPLRLTVHGIRLRAVRDPDGRVHVEGLPTPAGDAAASTRLGFPARLRLLQAEVMWEDRRTGRPPVRIAPVNLDLTGGPAGLRGQAQLVTPHGELQLAATLAGDLGGTAWSGTVRARATALNLAALLGDYLPEHYRLSGLVLDGDVLSHWQNARPTNVRGRLDARELRLAGASAVEFQRLGAQLHFTREDDAWRLQLDDLTVRRDGRSWPAGSALAASFSRAADGRIQVRAAADFLRLQDLVAVLLVRAPWAELEQPARDFDPRGDLHDLQLQLAYDAAGFDWQAAARFNDLEIRHVQQVPGLSKLSGRLRATPQHIQIDLDSRDLTLDFGTLFRAPLTAQRLQGRLDWLQREDGGWVLQSRDLQLDTAALRTRSRLSLQARGQQPLLLDLQTEFRDGDASQAAAYYPVGVMAPPLVAWLDRGIGAGRVTAGTAVVHGPLADFPFHRTRNGHFEVLFEVRDLTLDYREGWPPLEQVAARARFHNNSLAIELDSARIYDSQVGPTTARFEQLHPATPLEIRGSVTGPLADELRLLSESPLRDEFGDFVAGLRASGDARLELDFAVPVNERGQYRLAGALQFAGAGLELVDWELPLSDIRGRLQFDLDALRATDLRARGLGTELRVAVEPTGSGSTRVLARGQLDVPTIQDRLPDLPLQRASGHSDFLVAVEVPGHSSGAQATTWLQVDTDLHGMRLDLPEPLGKPAGERRPLQVRMALTGSEQALHFRYQDQLDATLSRDASRGEVQFGGATSRLPEAPGWRLRGSVPPLDLEAWLPLLREFVGAAEGATPALDVDLKFDRLGYGKLALHDLALQLDRTAQGLSGRIDAPTLAGRFTVPDDPDHAPLRVELEHLHLSSGALDDGAAAAPAGDPQRLDPRAWPPLSLRCQELVIDQARLGQLQLTTARSEQGLRIEQLQLDGELAQFAASGSWEWTPAGPRTRLQGRLQTADSGRLARQLGYTPQLRDSAADLNFDLNWPGDPALFADLRLDGELDLAIRQGRFADIDPGVTRVIGLLNFNALQRRLRLDFSDLFKKGFSFDSIHGHFTLDAGDAYTNDLTIDSPSGKIEVAGRTGLVSRDLDQLVTVTPRLDATLPVAGAIAGGPVAGLAVLVAQQLMSKQVDRINRFQYSVSGSWLDPEITQLESGGSLSRLLRPFTGETTPATAPQDQPPADGAPPEAAGEPMPTGEPPQENAAQPQEQAPAGTLDRLLDRLKPQGSGSEVLQYGD